MSTITIETSEHRVADPNDAAYVQYPTVVTIDGEQRGIDVIDDDAFDAVQQLCDVIVAVVTCGSDDTVCDIARCVDVMHDALRARGIITDG